MRYLVSAVNGTKSPAVIEADNARLAAEQFSGQPCVYHSGRLDRIEGECYMPLEPWPLIAVRVASEHGGPGEPAEPTRAELVKALDDTLRALKRHLQDEARGRGLKHASELCPCWDNEVRFAEAVLARARPHVTAGGGA